MFEEIDLLFAKNFSKREETLQFLAKLFCLSRQGHICMKDSGSYELPDCVRQHKDLYYLRRNWDAETKFIHHFLRLKDTISIITGGPGTGKTYTASQIVKTFSGKVLLAAPTGKAAARLGGKTLHSLLEFPEKKETLLFADLIIVDECSMIDIHLFAHFLASVKTGTRVILLGDPNQLPSIEGGALFADLIAACPEICTHLKHNYRSQDEITQLAYAVLEKSPEEALATLQAYLSQMDPLEAAAQGYMILSSLKPDQLNQKIMEELGSETFPVIVTKNNRELNLYNGQMGTLVKEMIHFPDGRIFPAVEVAHFDYAYAISVHKSQGSEYEKVLLLLPPGSDNFGKELLYTAITRAKTEVKIHASPDLLLSILRKTTHRLSGLVSRLVGCAGT